MCKVKLISDNEKQIVVRFTDGKVVRSKWFSDFSEPVLNTVNSTDLELQIYGDICLKNNDSDVKSWSIKFKNNEDDTYYITSHAMKRLKERNGWNRQTSLRMVKKVIDKGVSVDETKGYLKHYAERKLNFNSIDCDMIFYGDKIYVFKGKNLITVLTVPSKTKCSYILGYNSRNKAIHGGV